MKKMIFIIFVLGFLDVLCSDSISEDCTKAIKDLFTAIKENNKDDVMAAIAKGADVNAIFGDFTRTPLNFAAELNRAELVPILLDHGANINALDLAHNTPLHVASYYNAVDVIQILLSYGADVNSNNFMDKTPLSAAVRWERKEAAAVLLKHGVRYDQYNWKPSEINFLDKVITEINKENRNMLKMFVKKAPGFKDFHVPIDLTIMPYMKMPLASEILKEGREAKKL